MVLRASFARPAWLSTNGHWPVFGRCTPCCWWLAAALANGGPLVFASADWPVKLASRRAENFPTREKTDDDGKNLSQKIKYCSQNQIKSSNKEINFECHDKVWMKERLGEFYCNQAIEIISMILLVNIKYFHFNVADFMCLDE